VPSRESLGGFHAGLALVVLLGLAFRFLYVLVLSPDTLGSGDARLYTTLANRIADGHGYTDPLAALGGESRPTSYHPPLFPYYLAVFSWLGIESQENHRLAGCLLGAGTVAAIGYLGRRVGGARVGLTAAALAALYPAFVGSDGAVMSESLYVLLVALAMLAAYRVVDQPTLRWAAVLGALIGLATLARAEGLLLLALLAPPAAWLGGPGRRLIRLGAVAAGCALVLVPWLVRNWIAFDRPAPIATTMGAVLAGANCRTAYEGQAAGSWVIFCVRPFQAPTEERQQAAYRRDGIRYLKRHTSDLPRVLPLRVLRTWSLYQPWWESGRAEGRQVDVEKAGVVFYWLLLPLAAWGAWLLRRRHRPLSLLLAPVVMVTLTSLLAYGIPRFRVAADISLVVLGAVALMAVAERLAARRRPAAVDAAAT
jgi:4-amino-4-deoxy-L-arabinose transferase-like glycosyltransferase